MANEPVLIKKYANRRLYDTGRSHYITLDDLAAMVRDGARVKVVDAKSGADLTRAVLIQVLLEEQERLDMLPPELLHHIIRVQGTLHAAPFARWLSESFAQWEALGSAMRQGVGATLGGADPARAWMQAMQTMTGFGGARATPEATSPAEPPEDTQDPEDTPEAPPSAKPSENADLDALRARMSDLLGRLGSD